MLTSEPSGHTQTESTAPISYNLTKTAIMGDSYTTTTSSLLLQEIPDATPPAPQNRNEYNFYT